MQLYQIDQQTTDEEDIDILPSHSEGQANASPQSQIEPEPISPTISPEEVGTSSRIEATPSHILTPNTPIEPAPAGRKYPSLNLTGYTVTFFYV